MCTHTYKYIYIYHLYIYIYIVLSLYVPASGVLLSSPKGANTSGAEYTLRKD